jgi:hypothetical protein
MLRDKSQFTIQNPRKASMRFYQGGDAIEQLFFHWSKQIALDSVSK